MASSVFKEALATPVVLPPPGTDSSAVSTTSVNLPTGKIIALPEDDGDALILILYILHFRNQALPAYIPPDTLIRVGVLATKYRCAHAISRATTQWFDRIFTEMASKQTNAAETLKMIQAAFILNEAMYFARFTGRYVRTSPSSSIKNASAAIEQVPEGVRRIKSALLQRQAEIFAALRLDVDLLIDPCSAALGKEAQHYIDYPHGTEPEASELTLSSDGEPDKPTICVVDSQAAPLYLGAMRDAGLWPPTVWGARTAEQLIEAVERFREPEYDDCDKCEFCQPLVEAFEEKLMLVKKLHRERLWGLCLDCFTAGGVTRRDCRFAHVKASTTKA
jgi:hypothetical protein